jgi:small subunit ribosomal protein S1
VLHDDLDKLTDEARQGLVPGQEVKVYVLRPRGDDDRPILSMSRTQSLDEWQKAEKMAADGELWEAEITGFNRGGLVVPFGNLQGFVPASQVTGITQSSSRSAKRNILRGMVHQRLWFKVTEVDQQRGRLILSERQGRRLRRRDCKSDLVDNLKEGMVLKGVVSSLCDFGAFVDIGGADGLIHLSEISWEPISKPGQKLSIGDQVEVMVWKLDRRRGRIGLSLKRLHKPWDTAEARYQEGQLVEGIVTRLADFGAFVRVEPGLEGLVHISELAEDLVLDPLEIVEEGEMLLLRVIRVDAAKRRLGLSLRQVAEEEWVEWAEKKRQEAAALAEESAEQEQETPEAEVAEEDKVEIAPLNPDED